MLGSRVIVRREASTRSPQKAQVFAMRRTLSMSNLHHAAAEAASWRGPGCDFQRGNQDVTGCMRRNDRIDPAARGAVANVGLLQIIRTRRRAQLVKLLLRKLLAGALGLSLRQLKECAGGLIGAHHGVFRAGPR